MGTMILEVIVCWLAAYLVCGIVHEGGHVLAGLLQGWKFMLLVIGPFKWYRDTDDKVKFGLEKNISLWGGIGGTVPREESDENIQIFAKTLIAGPAASLVFGAAAGVVMVLHFSLLAAMMCAVPIAMGIACILPGVKTGILYNDGTRYRRIKNGGREAAEEDAVFSLVMREQFCPGARFDDAKVAVMTASEDLPFRYMGHYYAYRNAQKDGDEAEMKNRIALMEEIKDKVPVTIREACAIEDLQ